jgi:hypothetical protein
MITQLSEETGMLAVGECLCKKNYIACAELSVKEDFEMIAVEGKGRDPKFTGEIIGIYMRAIEKLADRTGYMGNTTRP